MKDIDLVLAMFNPFPLLSPKPPPGNTVGAAARTCLQEGALRCQYRMQALVDELLFNLKIFAQSYAQRFTGITLKDQVVMGHWEVTSQHLT